MKTLIAIATLLVGSMAFAMPTVNDDSIYDVTVTQGSKTQNLTYEMKLTAYDSAKDMFTLSETVTQNGQTQQQESAQPGNSFFTDDQVSQILTGCATYGGSLEKLTTPAGDINTCALPLQDGSGKAWIANVAFGFAKFEQTQNGQTVSFLIHSFTFGK
jgi:hypothetical protein